MPIIYSFIKNDKYNPHLFFLNYNNEINNLDIIKKEDNNIILSIVPINIFTKYNNIIIFSSDIKILENNINNNRIFFIGLNEDIDNIDNNKNILYYSLSLIKKKGFNNLLKLINNSLENDEIFIYLDYNLILNNFFSENNINCFDIFKNKAKVSINVYNMQNTIIESFYSILEKIFSEKITENKSKKIKLKNIYNEDSKFLIFRSIKYNDTDYGWYILRNLNSDMKQYLLEKVDNDNIISFNINKDDDNIDNDNIYNIDNEDNEDEILITSTTINEQNTKSYYFTKNVFDCVLYPEEKISMLFELIN